MISFDSEHELVQVYQGYLGARGIQTESEVSCGRGFAADLVSRQTVWEAKLILDREALYQALGQVESYRAHLKKPKSAIFGLTPEVNPKQANRIAAWLRQQHQHLWILFVDTDPGFLKYCKLYNYGENNVRTAAQKPTAKPITRSSRSSSQSAIGRV